MNTINQINNHINDFVWGPVMLFLLVGVGIYFSLRLHLFQITKFSTWFKNTFGSLFKKQTAGSGAVTSFQALTTALAATVGTGNMVGVTSAIVSGGPGAVFWMWVSAFFGMMTKYAEIVLSIHFRKRNENGDWVGGPMHYIYNGLGKNFKWLAILFSVFGLLASFGIGNMTQINSITSSIETMVIHYGWIHPSSVNSLFTLKLVSGILLAGIVALVIIGGLKRIGSVTEKLVPFMCLIYIVGGIAVLFVNRNALLPSLSLIFSSIMQPQSVLGGVVGYTISKAMRFGIARGVFSNEAGLGSAPIAHAAAETDSAVKQGMWGIFEVFVDTMIICTFTALIVLSSGAYTGPKGLSGAPLTIAAFQSTFGTAGTTFLTIIITLFAFSTVLSWSLYGQRCYEFLFKGVGMRIYQIIFIACIVVASTLQLELVWNIADTLNGLMAIPNLIALIALSGTVITLTKQYFAGQQSK